MAATMEYKYQNETFLIRGCMMKVYNELGSGFLEKVYQEALAMELRAANVPHQREAQLQVYYKGVPLRQTFVADFICYDKIIVELKAVAGLTDTHRAQVYNYLKATDMELGLLVNFGAPKLEIERLFNYHKNRLQSTT